MDRGYPPSKWDDPPSKWDKVPGVSSTPKQKAVEQTMLGIGETLFSNTLSDQAKRAKQAQAYGRTLLSALQSPSSQPSSSSMSSALERIPASSDDSRRINPFPTDFGQKLNEQCETKAPKLKVLAQGSTSTQTPVHVGSSEPTSPVTNFDPDALRQKIMLAGINALAMNMNNPALQAQLLLGQNLAKFSPLVNLNNVATTGGAVKNSVPDGSGVLKYRAPDIDSFVFDQKAGYKFDSTTGLHYDANSGLFINLALRVFLRWDPLLNTYLRVDLPGLVQPLGGITRNSGPAISKSASSALPIMNLSSLNTPSTLTAGTMQSQAVPLGINQLSNPLSSSTVLPASQDSFMNEIWQRMRALAKEAIGETQTTLKDLNALDESSDSDGSNGRICKKSKRSSSSRSRSSSWKDRNIDRHRKCSSRSQSRSLSRGSKERSRGHKQSRKTHSSDRSHSRGRHRTHTRSTVGNSRKPRRRARWSRSRRRRSRSSIRGYNRSTSRSPGRTRGPRRSRSRGSRRSSSRRRRSVDRRTRSRSRKRSCSNGSRRSCSKGNGRSHSKERRSLSWGTRRSQSRVRQRSVSPDRHVKYKDMSSRPYVPKKWGKRRAEPSSQSPELSPKTKHIIFHDQRKRNDTDEDMSNCSKIMEGMIQKQAGETSSYGNEENPDSSDGLSEFEFLKETLDDDNRSVIVDEYEEFLEHDESLLKSRPSESEKEQMPGVGDFLGHLVTSDQDKCSNSDEQKPGGPVIGGRRIEIDLLAPLFIDESPKTMILVAPLPLPKEPKKSKGELALIKSFLKTSLNSEGIVYDGITFHIDKNVGAPCSYGLIKFPGPVAAAAWRSKHNSLIVNVGDWEFPPSEEPKLFLHFSDDNWTCQNCQCSNFPFRSLCHQCFIHREGNVPGPIKKSKSTTKWVATSKLTEWFSSNDHIITDLKSIMKDLKLAKSYVLRDPKFPWFPLGCVLETESWGESLRLHEFLHRVGRVARFVTPYEQFEKFTCSDPHSQNFSKMTSPESGEPLTDSASQDSKETNLAVPNKTEAASEPLPVCTDSVSIDNVPPTTAVGSGESAPTVIGNQHSNRYRLDKTKAIPPPIGAGSLSLPSIDAKELTPDKCCSNYVLWWNQGSTRYSDVLKHLFVQNPVTQVSPCDTVFVGPLRSCLKCDDASAAALHKVLTDKFEQDNLHFTDIHVHAGNSVGAPCAYALVKFETYEDAESLHNKYRDGLILPKYHQRTKREKTLGKNLNPHTSGENDFFKTFAYYCKPNWWCGKCSKFNFGLRSHCFTCFGSKESGPHLVTLSDTPTRCVSIRKFQHWCASEELLYEADIFFKNHKDLFTVKFIKEESGIPLGVCVLETKTISDAVILLSQLRKTAGRKTVMYGTLHQRVPANEIGINGSFVEDEFRGLFVDRTPTKILFLGPTPNIMGSSKALEKVLLSEGVADCVEVEWCSAEAVGAPCNYSLIHFKSVDSATNWHDIHQGRMVLKREILPDGTLEEMKPDIVFLHFSSDNWACGCGSKNFTKRSICFTCYKGRNAKSSLISLSSTPTKWLGVRSAKIPLKKALGLKHKNYESYKIVSVTFYSDPEIPQDNFGIFIMETESVQAALRLREFYSSIFKRSTDFFTVEDPEPGNSSFFSKRVFYQVKANTGRKTWSNSGSAMETDLAVMQKEVLVCPDYETIFWTSFYESRLNKPPTNVVMISLCPGDRELPDKATIQILESLREAGVNCEGISYSFKGDVGSPFSYCLVSFDSVDSAKSWVDECNGTFKFNVPCPENEKTPLNFQNCYLQKTSSGSGIASYFIKSKLHYSSSNWLCSCGSSNFPLRSLCHDCFKNRSGEKDYESVPEATVSVGVKLTEYRALGTNFLYVLPKLGHKVLKVAMCLDPALPRDPCGVIIFEMHSVEHATNLYNFLSDRESLKLQDKNSIKPILMLLDKSSGVSYFKCPKSLEPRWASTQSVNWDSIFTSETPTNIIAVDVNIVDKPVIDIPLEQYEGKIRRCKQLGGFIPACWLIYFPTSQAAKEWYDANSGKLKNQVGPKLNSMYFTQDLWGCVSCFSPNFPARVLCRHCYRHRVNGFSPVSLAKKTSRFVGVRNEFEQQQAISSLIDEQCKRSESFRLRSVQIFCDPNLRQDGTCIFVFEVGSLYEALELRTFFGKRSVKSTFFKLNDQPNLSSHIQPPQCLAESGEDKDPKSISDVESSIDLDKNCSPLNSEFQIRERNNEPDALPEVRPLSQAVDNPVSVVASVPVESSSDLEFEDRGGIPMNVLDSNRLQEGATCNIEEGDSFVNVSRAPNLSPKPYGQQKMPQTEPIATPSSVERVECQAGDVLDDSTADGRVNESVPHPDLEFRDFGSAHTYTPEPNALLEDNACGSKDSSLEEQEC